tara:strand:+ start:21 stop:425 length:405 start_codon:yes stop_codon:yes gene_type:complete
MKVLFLSIFITSILFLIIDLIWLSFSVKYFYKPQLGSLLNEKPVMWAAVLFYLIYVVGLAIIILQPAIKQDSITQAFFTGIVFGIVAYGTYNFTNMATIRNWSPYVVLVDIIWGGFLTGTSSALGIYLSKKFLF